MDIQNWLNSATEQLEIADIATARLDSLILLEDVFGKDRSYILAHPDIILSNSKLKLLNNNLKRRLTHEPLAYIRGKSEFYTREFIVSVDTLQPRPETETIISELLTLLKDSPLADKKNLNLRVVDIGTGSGCIAITLKKECPSLEVYATDVSSKALDIAKRNSKKHNAKITFYESDLLNSLPQFVLNKPYILITNLPYVPNNYHINMSATFEPKQAIFGGVDGLDLYRKLFEQIHDLKTKPTYILTESMPSQHDELARIANKARFELFKTNDFIQIFKI